MAEQEFKPGQMVRHKAGGPKMAVVDMAEYGLGGEMKVKCTWMEGNKKYEETFEPATLERLGM